MEELLRQLQEARLRAEQAEARNKETEAQRQIEQAEARRQIEEATARTAEAERLLMPTTLTQFIEEHHKLWEAIPVVTASSLATSGHVTNPTGRLYPRRIIPWDGFVDRQQKIWEKLSGSGFSTAREYIPLVNFALIRSRLDPVGSEAGLRTLSRDVVEKAVQELIENVYKDSALQVQLDLKGTITFDSHLNLNLTSDETGGETAVQAPSPPLDDDGSESCGSQGKGKRQARTHSDKTSSAARNARPATRPRGKGGRADQFCIYHKKEGRNVPVAAIEYKAPHKLQLENIVAGLTREIVVDEHIIGRDDDSKEYLSERLMAAVVTQCFSYMVHLGLQDGYVFTGQAVLFLHIPEDPTVVYYHVCIPSLDVLEDDDDRLHRTAVAQVFAFVLHALAADPPSQAWNDATASLDTWAVEYIEILGLIPETDRKSGPAVSAYKPGRWKEFVRSPIRTRARCANPTNGSPRRDNSDDDGDNDELNRRSPTPLPRLTRSARSKPKSTAAASVKSGTASSAANTSDSERRVSIEDRPFCTQSCLLGLLHGRALDGTCPNVSFHKSKHISPKHFLRLVKTQLATDRGRDADCTPLYLKGARGGLFKVRLSSHGYTLVSKGMREHQRRYLEHEGDMYQQALELQGTHIPVCIGKISLVLPYYAYGDQYTHMLFLSWGGKPLLECINPDNQSFMLEEALLALKELHRCRVAHGDAELRNFLYDEAANRVMIIDLERSAVWKREPLAGISSNRKRKREVKEKAGDEPFDRELRAFENCTARYVRQAARGW